MSKYTGKCDFADHCEMHHNPQEIVDKYDVYAYGHDIIPLKIETPKDLLPYYPYLTAVSAWDGGRDRGVIHLSSQSFIDREEAEHLEIELENIKRYWRRCKRNKTHYDPVEAALHASWGTSIDPWTMELAERVGKEGEKATIEGVHDDWHDRYRKEFYSLLVENGYDEGKAYKWVYGWKRWLDKVNKEREANKDEGS